MSGRPETAGAPWRLYVAAAVAGLLAGLCGAAFHALLDQAGNLRSNAHGFLDDAPVPGWLVLMTLGAVTLTLAAWLVRRFAPETAGSGVQEVEAILAGDRGLNWRRVLPIKFVAGTLAVGSGLVLGREGPTVHMGAAFGQMSAEGLRLDQRQQRALVAAGAGAGLAAAFNAPLAAIVFVTEELREHFEYRFASIQSVILASCLAVAVSGWLLGLGPDLPLPSMQIPPIWALPLFLLLGVAIGALGVVFNSMLLGSVRAFKDLRGLYGYLPTALAGIVLGGLVWFFPETVGGGESLVSALIHQPPVLLALALLLALRLLTTVGSYGLGLPGGIFAPLLALGTIAGAMADALIQGLGLESMLSPGVFAVAAMGALFAATVRAPLTGIILAIELTGAVALVLPVILTCLSATFAAEALGGRPVYSLLLSEGGRTTPSRRPRARIAATGTLLAALLSVVSLVQLRQPEEPAGPAIADVISPGPPVRTKVDEPANKPVEPRRQATTDAPDETTAEMKREAAHEPAPNAERQTTESAPARSTVEPSTITASRGSEQSPPVVGAGPLATPTSDSAKTAGTDAPERETIEASPPPAAGPSYSIQLASFRRLANVARAARGDEILERASTLEPVRGWYPLLFGNFATRAEAEAALAALPDRLKRQGPFIRKLAAADQRVPLR